MRKTLLAIGLTIILTTSVFFSVAAAKPNTLDTVIEKLDSIISVIGTKTESDTTIKEDTTAIKGYTDTLETELATIKTNMVKMQSGSGTTSTQIPVSGVAHVSVTYHGENSSTTVTKYVAVGVRIPVGESFTITEIETTYIPPATSSGMINLVTKTVEFDTNGRWAIDSGESENFSYNYTVTYPEVPN